jgi:hypothetical protein
MLVATSVAPGQASERSAPPLSSTWFQLTSYPAVQIATGQLYGIPTRVETKMHFLIFAKMRKSCENGMIFAKSPEISFSRKSIKFDSDTACMVHVV